MSKHLKLVRAINDFVISKGRRIRNSVSRFMIFNFDNDELLLVLSDMKVNWDAWEVGMDERQLLEKVSK